MDSIGLIMALIKSMSHGVGKDGKSAYAYAVEGGYTGTEEEFAAKLAAEKFANPNALTFTGAVAGSYDGSAAVTVEIPSGEGSGGGEQWEELLNVTTEEEVSHVIATLSNPGKFKLIAFAINTEAITTSSTQKGMYVSVNNTTAWSANTSSNLWYYADFNFNYNHFSYGITRLTPVHEATLCVHSNKANSGSVSYHKFEKIINIETEIKSIQIGTQNWDLKFGVGSEFKVYGVRA